MKVSTNHAPEKVAWLETVPELLGQELSHSTPNHSPKSFDKTNWDSKYTGKERTSESSGSPTGSGLSKRSNSTSLTTSHQVSVLLLS
jgi:hypothetical protein